MTQEIFMDRQPELQLSTTEMRSARSKAANEAKKQLADKFAGQKVSELKKSNPDAYQEYIKARDMLFQEKIGAKKVELSQSRDTLSQATGLATNGIPEQNQPPFDQAILGKIVTEPDQNGYYLRELQLEDGKFQYSRINSLGNLVASFTRQPDNRLNQNQSAMDSLLATSEPSSDSSTVRNPDGSTTTTTTFGNGGIAIDTVSADGQSRSGSTTGGFSVTLNGIETNSTTTHERGGIFRAVRETMQGYYDQVLALTSVSAQEEKVAQEQITQDHVALAATITGRIQAAGSIAGKKVAGLPDRGARIGSKGVGVILTSPIALGLGLGAGIGAWAGETAAIAYQSYAVAKAVRDEATRLVQSTGLDAVAGTLEVVGSAAEVGRSAAEKVNMIVADVEKRAGELKQQIKESITRLDKLFIGKLREKAASLRDTADKIRNPHKA